ncbi:hypothetical protein NIES4074_03160 [Cylindrospermum sp. NIES-4074]|nr:hypothetical protein NIES4074_03160 [Cylindrospermum sp. NIES-4074]
MSENCQGQDDNLALSKTNPFLEPSIAGVLALINTIPVFGTIINVPLAAGMVAWQNRNLNKFILIVEQKFDSLDKSKLDKKFLNSAECIDIFVQAVEAAMKTSSEERCNALANALLAASVTPTSLYIGKQMLIRVLAQMSDEEMQVLRILYKEEMHFSENQGQPGQKAIPVVPVAEIAAKLKWEYVDVLVACQGLLQLGLAHDPMVGNFNRLTDFTISDEPASFRIKQLGWRTIEYALGAY